MPNDPDKFDNLNGMNNPDKKDDFVDSSFLVQFKPGDKTESVADKLKESKENTAKPASNGFKDSFNDEFDAFFDNYQDQAPINAFKPFKAPETSSAVTPPAPSPEPKPVIKPAEPVKSDASSVPAFPKDGGTFDKPAQSPFAPAPAKESLPKFNDIDSANKAAKPEDDKFFKSGNGLDFATSEHDKNTSPFMNAAKPVIPAPDEVDIPRAEKPAPSPFKAPSASFNEVKSDSANVNAKSNVIPDKQTPVAPSSQPQAQANVVGYRPYPSATKGDIFNKPADQETAKPESAKAAPAPAAPVAPATPAKPAEPVKSTAPAAPAKPAEPVKTAAVATAATAATVATAATISNAAKPAPAPAAPTASAAPAAPAKPASPFTSPAAVKPAAPVAAPAPAVKPAEAVKPAAPAKPVAPAAPVAPAKPVAPAAPVASAKPAAPAAPVKPAAASNVVPAKPAEPVKAAAPAAPAPVKAAEPAKVSPAAAVKSATPVTPAELAKAANASKPAAKPVERIQAPAETEKPLRPAASAATTTASVTAAKPAPAPAPATGARPGATNTRPAVQNDAYSPFEPKSKQPTAATRGVANAQSSHHDKAISPVTPVKPKKRKKETKAVRDPGLIGLITFLGIIFLAIIVLWALDNTSGLKAIFGKKQIETISTQTKEKETETEETDEPETSETEKETETESETTVATTTESETTATTETETEATTTTTEATTTTTEATTTTTEATTTTSKKPSTTNETAAGSSINDFDMKITRFSPTAGGFKFDIELKNKSNYTANLPKSLKGLDIKLYSNATITEVTSDAMEFTGDGTSFRGTPKEIAVGAGETYTFTVYVSTSSSVTSYGYNYAYFDWYK